MSSSSASSSSSSSGAVWTLPEWAALRADAAVTRSLHLRDLLQDRERCALLSLASFGGSVLFDYSRQRITPATLRLLEDLWRARRVGDRIVRGAEWWERLGGGVRERARERREGGEREARGVAQRAMAGGEKINVTEQRAVLHMALRAAEDDAPVLVEGRNVLEDVHAVLRRVFDFADRVRSGAWAGASGKRLRNVVSIGIGGSYLGPEFVFEALRQDPTAHAAAAGRSLRFLANVDPVDVSRALDGLDPEETLVVIVSKTFTTAETMLNAKTVRQWLLDHYRTAHAALPPRDVVARHVVAVSTNLPLVEAFGIHPENAFGFWDWVGGRYSVCSAVGVVPLALQYGSAVVREFLAGAREVDRDVVEKADRPRESVAALMALVGVWNCSFLQLPTRALLPYAQGLARFPAHVQQVDMESNGKGVTVDGERVPEEEHCSGEVDFGEPGTNGQHSFYQLLHQGTQVVPADFIGFTAAQTPLRVEGEAVDNHDELMSNFFAQPDALARGKTLRQVMAEAGEPLPEGAAEPDEAVARKWRHKEFTGNRPSSSLLFRGALDARSTGMLLALYEHRTALQGFLWGLPSFDQWGVELGKKLAVQVRRTLSTARAAPGAAPALHDDPAAYNPSTASLLHFYLDPK